LLSSTRAKLNRALVLLVWMMTGCERQPPAPLPAAPPPAASAPVASTDPWCRGWGDGNYQKPYAPRVLEVVDLARDGVPEIVTELDASFELGVYSIFKRGPAGWRQLFRSGC
jgi:hypothetical protein